MSGRWCKIAWPQIFVDFEPTQVVLAAGELHDSKNTAWQQQQQQLVNNTEVGVGRSE